jgi:outer membrane protein TolC
LEVLDPDSTVEFPEYKAAPLIQSALNRRPDIQQLHEQVKQAERAIGLAESSFYPRFQAVGAYNGTRQGDVSLTGEDFGDMIGVNMAWNIFSGGADKARIIEAEQQVRELKFQFADLRNSVASEIRQNLALLSAAAEQVRLQRDSVSLVKENRELAKNEYEAGEASLVRLNEAQRDFNATYSNLARALVGYQRARQQLLAATGGILEPFFEPTVSTE